MDSFLQTCQRAASRERCRERACLEKGNVPTLLVASVKLYSDQ